MEVVVVVAAVAVEDKEDQTTGMEDSGRDMGRELDMDQEEQ